MEQGSLLGGVGLQEGEGWRFLQTCALDTDSLRTRCRWRKTGGQEAVWCKGLKTDACMGGASDFRESGR